MISNFSGVDLLSLDAKLALNQKESKIKKGVQFSNIKEETEISEGERNDSDDFTSESISRSHSPNSRLGLGGNSTEFLNKSDKKKPKMVKKKN
jgi:hypothetical protein